MKIRTVLFLGLLFTLNSGFSQNHVLHFDGVNDYINLGSNAGDGIRSIELWFRSNIEIGPNNTERYTMVTRNSDDQNGEFGIFIGYDFLGEQGRLTFTRQVGNTFHYVYSDQNHWEANRWYHVAGVIDPVEGMKLYIDGILQQDSDPSTEPTEMEHEITTIGCWGNNYNRWFEGEIDEVRFWTHALSQDEILEYICEAANPGSTEYLWCYYPMNENSGLTLINFGIEGSDGNIVGPVFQQADLCETSSQPPLLWLKGIQGSLDEEGLDICTDKTGAIISCGYFNSNTLYAGEMSLDRNSNCDAYVIKYNMNGIPIWMDNPGGTNYQEAHGVRADQDNNIYVTGHFYNDFQFAGTSLIAQAESDAFLIKYNEDGDEIWAISLSSPAEVKSSEIAIDHEGDIILGIRYYEQITIEQTTLFSNGSLDLAIAKFNPNGDLIWAKSFGGNSLDFVMNLCVDDQEHVYFTGGAHSGSITFGNFTLPNYCFERLAFIVHLDENGEVLWAEGHDDGYDQEYFGIAVDSDHNIYTSGYYKEVFYFGPHAIYGDAGHFDVFIAKYNANHEHQWIKKITTYEYGRSDHLILDLEENPVMNIVHFGGISIEGQYIPNEGERDMTLLSFNPVGGLRWTLHAGDALDERSFGLASGPFDNLYFTGYFNSQQLEIDPFSIQNMGGMDSFIAAMGPPCPPPNPNFEYDVEDFIVQFTANWVADTYYWEFGDGVTSTLADPIHTYETFGEYQVCLTITDVCGQNTDCKTINICVDPTADFAFDVNELEVAFYQFSNLADDFQWGFGDGTHSYEPEPVHTYDDYGNYIVSLTVFNDCGADQHFDTVYLLEPMMCNFSFTLDENGVVQFQDESLDASSCFWDFGDGTTSTEQNPAHQYKANGTYHCCLTIENAEGSFNFCDDVLVESFQEEQTDLNIYIDPVGKSLKIDIPADGYYEIIIYDTWGKLAFSDDLFLSGNSVYELGLTNLPAGVYIVSIQSEQLHERIKVMVPSF